jgi:uncharacterized SAM-binding protein YcdF (DUF218 family)
MNVKIILFVIISSIIDTMFFILSKIISLLLSPLIWIILLFLCWLIWRRKIFIISATMLLLLFSNPFIFKCVINWWEPSLAALPMDNDSTKTVVVLGGYAAYNDEFDRIRFQQSGDRLMQALLVLKKNHLNCMVLSGGSANLLINEKPESLIVKTFLTNIKMTDCQMIIDSVSRNTHENAIETAKLFNASNIPKNIYLVTSAWHMKRAMGCFVNEGFLVTPVHADPMASIEKASFNDYIIPSSGTLTEWEILIKEWIGLTVYKFKGYI